MTTPATSVEDQSLFDAIAGLLPAELREHFYRRMAHLRNLTPNDELLQIAEAMGFLAIVTRQAPAEIATERAKLETLFQEAGSALKLAHASTIAYQHELDQRLEELPVGIAVALNPQNVAALLSETLRQQFHEIGIPAVSETLSTQSQILPQNYDRIQQPTRDVLRSRARDVESGECGLDFHAGRFEQRCEPCPGPQPCAG